MEVIKIPKETGGGGTDLDGTQINNRIPRGDGANTIKTSLWNISDAGVMSPETDGLNVGISGTKRVGQSWMQELRVQGTGSSSATTLAQLDNSSASTVFRVLGDGEVNTRDGISQGGVNLIKTTSSIFFGSTNTNVIAGELAMAGEEGNTEQSVYIGHETGEGIKANQAVFIGARAKGVHTGNSMIAIGYESNAAFTASLAMGRGATTTKVSQAVFGSPGYGLGEYYFGRGVENTAGQAFDVFFYNSNATGLNKSSGDWYFQTGKPTGSADGGEFGWAISNGGASGTTQRTQSFMLRLQAGKVGFHNATPVVKEGAMTVTDGTLARAIVRIAELETTLQNLGLLT